MTEATATAGALQQPSGWDVSIRRDDLSRRRITPTSTQIRPSRPPVASHTERRTPAAARTSAAVGTRTAWQELLDAGRKSLNSEGDDAE
ncbi:hypothetical protein AB0M97_01170 [Streptomyces sp. NPDC051207]|uniref:hypothetical protein n=1 Tax=Streptomyces sp. NPDC051207 TaxID=3154641 RepID=UPI003447B3A9